MYQSFHILIPHLSKPRFSTTNNLSIDNFKSKLTDRNYESVPFIKNSKDMLECLKSRSLSSGNSHKTFDFSTLYTTIPHSKLKEKFRALVHLYFIKKDGNHRFKYLVLGRTKPYFVVNTSDSNKKYSEDDICGMLDCFIDNIFGGRVSTDCHHSNGDQLCTPSRRFILFVRMNLTSYRAFY